MTFYLRQALLFSLLIVLSVNCEQTRNTEQPKNSENKAQTDPLPFEMVKIDRFIDGCLEQNCTKVHIAYPRLTLKGSEQAKINGALNAEIKETLSLFSMESNGEMKIGELIEAFFQEHSRFKNEFPESSPWYVNMDTEITYESNTLISLKTTLESYTGGTQINKEVRYLNFNRSGEKLKEYESVFTSIAGLTQLAEKQFRKQNDLTATENLADNGYRFDNNKFALSTYFGFNENGLVLHYQPFEISDYAHGPVVIAIPFSALGNLTRQPLN